MHPSVILIFATLPLFALAQLWILFSAASLKRGFVPNFGFVIGFLSGGGVAMATAAVAIMLLEG